MSAIARRMVSLLIALTAFSNLAGAQTDAASPKEEDKGAWIERKDGQKLNLRIEGDNFQLRFFDKDKEPMKPDAASAMLHYTSRIVRARETLFLSPVTKEEKTILASPRYIRAPYQFEILLVLNFNADGEETESYHLIFQQEAPPVTTPRPPPPAR